MNYIEFLHKLQPECEEAFAAFQRKLVPTQQKILGIRTPKLRKIAKEAFAFREEILAYPDEYFEVTLTKAMVIASLPFAEYLKQIESLLDKFDNWAVCDLFKPKCIAKNKEAYLPYLEKFFHTQKEFLQRHVLIVLLTDYIEPRYYPLIERFLSEADTDNYYVYMASAWLTAEILVKDYEEGIRILQSEILDSKTHNKAIQKAKESYRLTKQQKEELNTLKNKKR
ncbi:MAG: DNA alkylation repair protein [Clostridia bacterium]|nr:DNA alkylation repair protein [Clostridia bacterium]